MVGRKRWVATLELDAQQLLLDLSIYHRVIEMEQTSKLHKSAISHTGHLSGMVMKKPHQIRNQPLKDQQVVKEHRDQVNRAKNVHTGSPVGSQRRAGPARGEGNNTPRTGPYTYSDRSPGKINESSSANSPMRIFSCRG